ncbi:hypothetical protein N7513_008853 [Penicillium frequentans]|nr:hypothetical protein N7513_008853 [Penicillium glabrum]
MEKDLEIAHCLKVALISAISILSGLGLINSRISTISFIALIMKAVDDWIHPLCHETPGSTCFATKADIELLLPCNGYH